MKKLNRKLIQIISILTVFWLIVPNTTFAQSTEVESGYVSVNGLNYYYEIHGEGDLSAEASAQAEPLLLLHGGLGSFEMFNAILPMFTESRQVIGVDLHGHGRTALDDRKFSIIAMGDDMAAILKELGYEKVDVMGYSAGGGVALRLAIQHPEVVNKLVLVSTGFSRDGFYPGILKQQAQVGAEMAEMMKQTPMYKVYAKLAPNPEGFPKLLEQTGNLMKQPYDWSKEVKQLEMPVMLIYGDSDMYRPEHMVDFYQLLGGGLRDAGWKGQYMSQNRLAILPGLTHYNIFLSPELAETALGFLNGYGNRKSWNEQVEKTGN